MPNLFKLFGKLENLDRKRLDKTGIGLGLSISQNIIKLLNQERHEEIIKATSKWQEGQLFQLFSISLHSDSI
jgi:K+-sensing histidine kinase KdpD